MTSLLGVAELPLAILLWSLVAAVGVTFLLAVVAVVGGGIEEYRKHKDQMKWDDMVRGIRR